MDNPRIMQALIDKAGLKDKSTLLIFVLKHLSSQDDDNDALADQLLGLQEKVDGFFCIMV